MLRALTDTSSKNAVTKKKTSNKGLQVYYNFICHRNLSDTNISKKRQCLKTNATHTSIEFCQWIVSISGTGKQSPTDSRAGKSLSRCCNLNMKIPLPSSNTVVFYLRTQPSSTSRSASASTSTIQATSPWPMSHWYPNLRTGRIIIAGKQTKCCQTHKVNTWKSCNL